MKIPRVLFTTVAALSALTATAQAAESISSCVTRRVEANFFGSSWLPQDVCQQNEIAVSAGGFCSGAGQMVGVSTTVQTVDRKVWLWCTKNGSAFWYAMCCQSQ